MNYYVITYTNGTVLVSAEDKTDAKNVIIKELHLYENELKEINKVEINNYIKLLFNFDFDISCNKPKVLKVKNTNNLWLSK